MELTEAFERVVLRHWVLIAVCVVLTCIGATIYATQQQPVYRASARFLLDASDPTSDTAAQALADTAKGLATAPTTVKDALGTIGVVRDPVQVAQHVSVVPLGSSGVLLLSVTDSDPAVAKALTNRLTQSVISTRSHIGSSGVTSVLANLDRDISEATTELAKVGNSINSLTAELGTKSDPGTIAALNSRLIEQRSKQSTLAANRDALNAERASLIASDALKPQASVIDLAGSAVRVNGFALPAAIALALVLGLVIGVTIAGVKETFGPTVGGRAALVREAGAPYLGSLPAPPWSDDANTVKMAASHVRLAAIAAGVDRVELIGADPSVDLMPLTREMTAALGDHARSGPQISVIDSTDDVAPLTSRAKTTKRRTALVLITPAIVRRSAFQAVSDYRSLAGLDLIGVVDYRRYRWSSNRKRSAPSPTIGSLKETNPPELEVQAGRHSAEEEAVNS